MPTLTRRRSSTRKKVGGDPENKSPRRPTLEKDVGVWETWIRDYLKYKKGPSPPDHVTSLAAYAKKNPPSKRTNPDGTLTHAQEKAMKQNWAFDAVVYITGKHPTFKKTSGILHYT